MGIKTHFIISVLIGGQGDQLSLISISVHFCKNLEQISKSLIARRGFRKGFLQEVMLGLGFTLSDNCRITGRSCCGWGQEGTFQAAHSEMLGWAIVSR